VLSGLKPNTENLKLSFMAYQSFEDLEVWQRACRIAAKTFEVLKSCRDYGLRDQMTRSAVSIASNIAEGAERDSLPEFVRFLNIAKGSAAELRTQVYIAGSAQLIPEKTQQEMVVELKSISAMLQGLIKSINAKRE
jgi:four helix bundle protein